MLNIALFGPPGAGKGTQAKKIVEKYNLAHLSTGDMIRKEIAEGTELGKIAEEIIARGELLSDEFVVRLIENSMAQHRGVNGFLFDGFPRSSIRRFNSSKGTWIQINPFKGVPSFSNIRSRISA